MLTTLSNTTNLPELKSLLLSILHKLSKKWEDKRSSCAVDQETKEYFDRNNFLSTRTLEELKLMLLLLSFDELRPRQGNVAKERRLHIQIKVVTEFWKELKIRTSENIGDLPKPLLIYLRDWRIKAKKVEIEAENLLKSIKGEWDRLQKYCSSN
ncbi:unnamed protein product [Rodentolepis nana]|uniref:Uncharacterized protein n=1 Tax=Rodentolepis nana TaxID=102285 RepID=A0A0R3TH00_RODNA|nr:unnamed protein product [Rodentolepis nana]